MTCQKYKVQHFFLRNHIGKKYPQIFSFNLHFDLKSYFNKINIKDIDLVKKYNIEENYKYRDIKLMKNIFPSSILVIAAHPDDEILMAGGTMARNFKEGGTNSVIFMTNGVGSREEGNFNSDFNIRALEAEKANNTLGSSIIKSYDFPDNALDNVSLLSLIKTIENHIDIIKPDIIITHSQDELNIDHQLVGRAVITANRPKNGRKNILLLLGDIPSSCEWSISNWKQKNNLYIDIENFKDLKYEAMRCYKSECREPPNPRAIELLKSRDCLIGSEAGLNCAESFYIQRITL